ncbi:mitochondrial cardiolipin hydrolase isoform X1 [Gadus macrocephalus]|uniref:mitochondrial cardiolipin hydrolase isoform X1 n=1 Tax=Gadus macrocephalus TaxID=80720 RepID=UPI0028CBB7F0|nr:mitochondrial cardiolipin hydrolase isoform X1 [Gadus macrocephalus]XP_059902971.1 mitochondrial cardiolipin hydrolase isoform X1 [Gadus macrocephalus]XP_059902972.1 mitochondrial cardiolipin hydrolase isoform X1 [Gadus macrocephalus]XP_059902973.1 mitochondrial cardiolipin hydrolase isoform X1 [Gadus macrocephalus]XP_059902974.1 mitochondrial cardiolipin hydrolase isoform X1 [Gadus macrocephalus]
MSAVWTLKALGLGAVGLTLSVEVLGWFFRRFGSKGFLKEVIFFPTEFACVEHVFEPTLQCLCPLPHGLETSLARLLRHVLSAKSTLDICVFAFSNMDLSRAVLALHSRGLVIRILIDKDYGGINGSQIGPLRRSGIRVRYDSGAVHMHHKFALVDGRRLVTGSLNWTLQAVQKNKENVMVTEEPRLVTPFVQEFQRLWDANDPEGCGRAAPPPQQGTERQGTERQGTERQGTERKGTERKGTERKGT